MSLNLALLGQPRELASTKTGTAIALGDTSLEKFHTRITRKQMTDVQLATLALEKELRAYPDISEQRRYVWRDEMTNLEQIRYMNMRLLAAVLVYINQVLQERGENFTPARFTDTILSPFLDKVMGSEKKTPELVRAYKEDFIRYVRAVLTYREMRQEQLQEIQAQARAQTATADEDEDSDYE